MLGVMRSLDGTLLTGLLWFALNVVWFGGNVC